MAYPAKTKSANAGKRAFMYFAGAQDKIERFYCDNAQELEKAAAAQLEWRVDTFTPYRHTSNGVEERSDRRIIDGPRTLLHTSGHANVFAPCGMSTTRIGTARALMRIGMTPSFMAC